MVLQLQEEIKHIPLNVHDEPLCVDSQAFRYLALLETMKRPQYQKPEYDKVKAALAKYEKTYIESWTNSTEAVRAVFEQFFTVEPHDIKATLFLNKVRDQILRLTKPMGDVHIAIETDKNNIQIAITEITKNGGDMEALKKKLKGKGIEKKQLSKPITVCMDCATEVIDEFGSVLRDFATPCHDPCCLGEVPEEKFPEPRLQQCACMEENSGTDDAKCKCGHSWRTHLHTKYKLVWVEIVRPQIVQQISDLQNGVDSRAKQITILKAKMKEMEDEQNRIVQTSARCAIFLGQNSIFPYNSATEDYMKLMIEQQTKSGGASSPVVKALNEQLVHFRKHRDTLQAKLDTCTDIVGDFKNMYNYEEMQACIDELHQLKHFGKFFSNTEDSLSPYISRPATDKRTHTFPCKANGFRYALGQAVGMAAGMLGYAGK